MTLIRVVSRLILLSLVAAALAALTAIYGGSVQSRLPNSHSREMRMHRPAAPQLDGLPVFVAQFAVVAIFGVGGRIVLRLRLSPASPSEGQPILLGLHRESKAHVFAERRPE